jgi:hypothetical protein
MLARIWNLFHNIIGCSLLGVQWGTEVFLYVSNFISFQDSEADKGVMKALSGEIYCKLYVVCRKDTPE